MAYELIETKDAASIKAWTIGVPFEESAKVQARYISMLPCVVHHIALMPDTHTGYDVPIGAVVATKQAIVPAIISVDIGCGVSVVKTDLTSHQVSENGQDIFDVLTEVIPIDFWKEELPENVKAAWAELYPRYRKIIDKNGRTSIKYADTQLGSQGNGNHLFSVNLDENDNVWLMCHSGSRGVGHKVGSFFIEKARKEMEKLDAQLPNKNLAYFTEGTESFDEYFEAISWAQDYAFVNRQLMLENAVSGLRRKLKMKFRTTGEAVNCHHNYCTKEAHFGEDLYITRKGAVSAKRDEMAVILGCMGGKSYIVKGKGNPESFQSCAHGAGRVYSRSKARQSISKEQHIKDTEGVWCRKDVGVIDESPSAYKNIDEVMRAQEDLVETVHCLKEIVCIKG